MKTELEEINNSVLVNIYDVLKSAKEATMIVQMDKKKSEEELKKEIAEAKQLYKKDGTTLDLPAVKIATVKKAIEVMETGNNKLEAELALQEEYIADMENGNIQKGFVDSYVGKVRLEKETKESEKDIKEEFKTTVDSDIVEAIDLIVKGDIEIEKQRLEEDDGKTKKTKKDNSEVLILAKEIKKKLGI